MNDEVATEGTAAEFMDELRRRVAKKKALGLYSIDVYSGRVTQPAEPVHADDLARLEDIATVAPSFHVAPSTKPIIGPVVSLGKKAALRATREPVLNLAAQTTAFNQALMHYVTVLGQEVANLRSELVEIRTAIDAEGQSGASWNS